MKLGLSQRLGIVENFVADRSAGGQAVSRQHHARVEHLGTRHIDGGTVAPQFVRNGRRIELLRDLAGFTHVDIGEQQRFVLPADAEDQRERECSDDGRHAQSGEQPGRSRLQQQLRKAVHAASHAPARDLPLWANLAGRSAENAQCMVKGE